MNHMEVESISVSRVPGGIHSLPCRLGPVLSEVLMNCLLCGAWIPERYGPYHKDDTPCCLECLKEMSTDMPATSRWTVFVTGLLIGAALAFVVVWLLTRGGAM